ncbi:MAG: helix-turn-helix transcriptional regulator [Solobacterium sp.]|nr:helix-turn-helix transcriptional regulator [Solobacterium sp.]
MKKYRIKLWELLAERNLKITQVCKDTGLSRPTLNAIKYGRSKGIQLETIDVLCNYFKITPGELFTEVQPIKPVYPQKKIAAIKKITAI